jgi:fibronectin type 3 domain-containing protein
VYRSTRSGGPYSRVASVTGNAFNDTGVQAGATYFYVISAVDSSNVESAASSPEVTATVPN